MCGFGDSHGLGFGKACSGPTQQHVAVRLWWSCWVRPPPIIAIILPIECLGGDTTRIVVPNQLRIRIRGIQDPVVLPAPGTAQRLVRRREQLNVFFDRGGGGSGTVLRTPTILAAVILGSQA